MALRVQEPDPAQATPTTLGRLRALVARADKLGAPDDATAVLAIRRADGTLVQAAAASFDGDLMLLLKVRPFRWTNIEAQAAPGRPRPWVAGDVDEPPRLDLRGLPP